MFYLKCNIIWTWIWHRNDEWKAILDMTVDFKKCILFQNQKDDEGDKKLTNIKKGRETITEISNTLNDHISEGLSDFSESKYHVNTCYSKYSTALILGGFISQFLRF